MRLRASPTPDDRSPSRLLHGPLSWLTALCLLGLMGVALPHQVQGGDAGEFATVMLRGGVPHPSGYPWMRILGLVARAFETLGMPVMVAAALPCALCGVGAWLVIQRLFLAWGHPLAGSFVVLLVAASPTVALHVNDCEVWGPLLLLAALFLRVCLGGKARSALLLGFLLGVTVSHHLTGILLLPLAVGAAWPVGPNVTMRTLLRQGGLGLLGSTLGLLPLLSLALGSGGAWRWGDTQSVAGLIHHISRADYGVFQLSLHQNEQPLAGLWGRALSTLGESMSGGTFGAPVLSALFLCVVLALAVTLLWGAGMRRAVQLGWLGVLLTTTVVFPALHNINPSSPFGAWILERFDLLSLLVWSPVYGLAIVQLGVLTSKVRGAKILWSVVAVVLLSAQAMQLVERGLPAEEPGVEAYAHDVLVTAPSERRVLIFGTDDHRSSPLLFAQEVRGWGAHVLYIDAGLLAYPWYRAHLRQRWPELPDVEKPVRLMRAVWESPALQDTPIYLANVFSTPTQRLAKVPEGLLLRVLPPGLKQADPDGFLTPAAIGGRHLAALQRYKLRPGMLAGLAHPRSHPWSADLWHSYAGGSRQLSQRLRMDGHSELASSIDQALVQLLGPAALSL